jgi:hypothetical protein
MMNQIKTRTFLSDDGHDNNSDRKVVLTATKKVCHWFYGRKNLKYLYFVETRKAFTALDTYDYAMQ